MRIKGTQAGDNILIFSVFGGPLVETSTELYTTNVGEDISVVKVLTFLSIFPKVDSERKTFGNEIRKLFFAILQKLFPIQFVFVVNRGMEFECDFTLAITLAITKDA